MNEYILYIAQESVLFTSIAHFNFPINKYRLPLFFLKNCEMSI